MLVETKKSAGVTLTEIMFAMLILVSAMIPVSSLMGYGGRATSKDARRIVAIQNLEKTMRQIMQAPYDDIPIAKNILKDFSGVNLGEITAPSGHKYSISMTSKLEELRFNYLCVDVNNSDFTKKINKDFFTASETVTLASSAKEITIKVSWTENTSIPVEVSAVTYRANFGTVGAVN